MAYDFFTQGLGQIDEPAPETLPPKKNDADQQLIENTAAPIDAATLVAPLREQLAQPNEHMYSDEARQLRRAYEKHRRMHPTAARRWAIWKRMMVAAGLIPGQKLSGHTLYNNSLELVGFPQGRKLPNAWSASKDATTFGLLIFAHYDQYRSGDEPKTPKELYERWIAEQAHT